MGLITALLIYLACSIWMLVRIARSSLLLGIGTLVFYPVALIALVRNWGHPRDDIRIPFALTFVAWGAVVISAMQVLQEASETYEANLVEYEYEPMDEMELAILRRQLVSKLELRRGEIALAPLPASLEVPDRFRFVDQDGLASLAQAFGLPSLDDTVGMVIHESVDLIDDASPWLIWVSWHPTGHIPWGEPERIGLEFLEAMTARQAREVSAADEDDGFEPWDFERFGVPPQFDRQRSLITWAEEVRYRHTGDELLDCYAARPARRGYMLFVATDMPRKDEELCYRAVRLAASNLRYESGHAHADAGFFDKDSRFELKDIVTGLAQSGEESTAR